MVKVCHFISGDLWAGAEVMAFSLLKELQEFSEIDVAAIVFNEGRLALELRNADVPIFVVDEHSTSFYALVFQIRSLVQKLSPDVIHSHRYKENILAFLARGFRRKPRLIATQHGMPEGGSKRLLSKGRFVSGLNKFLLAKHFDSLVVVSDDMRQTYIQELGFNPQKVHTIHNGIELPARAKHHNTESGITVGSAGRFFPVKDYPLMVEIARTIKEKGYPVAFELAGDGPQRDIIGERISSYGLDDAFLLKGHVEDMADFYAGIDVFLNTSVHEGIPMSILEAMSYGLPVVAPKVGGIMEIITDEVDGFLIKDRNPMAFAEKIIFLEDNPEILNKMGRAAMVKVEEEYSAGAMAEKYLNLYFKAHLAGSPKKRK
ncbi:glycosyltransferase family 4 protein [Desulfosalsimonas propionicica]|nr:glycosyltransferase family 4 protein [Desulfosalsimonas propionicica]